MVAKVKRSEQAPTDKAQNISADLVSFLEIMKVFANRREVQNDLEELKGADKNAFWRLLTPLYERAAEIQETVLELQELQDDYPVQATVEMELRSMQERLASIRDQFHKKPDHFQNPSIETFGYADKIRACHGNTRLLTGLETHTKAISSFAKDIEKTEKVLHAIYSLYPPRLPGQKVLEEGLLDQLLNDQRGIRQNSFKRSRCLAAIHEKLQYFSAEDQSQLRHLLGNGANLKVTWSQLGATLQHIYQRQSDLKNQHRVRFEAALDEADQWTQERLMKFQAAREKDHEEMLAKAKAISTNVSKLSQDASQLKLNLPLVSSEKGFSAFSALGAMLYWGLGLTTAALPVGVIAAGAGVTAAVTNVTIGFKQHYIGPKWVLPRVQEMFKRTLKLITGDSRVARGFATRVLAEIAKIR